jgi:hypothetical protein
MKYIFQAMRDFPIPEKVKIYPKINVTIKIVQCALITIFFILVTFLVNAAVKSIGIAIIIENNPADEVAITFGAPSSFKNNGTTAYTV